ncbi:porin family protein [Nonlabens marinus]|uniref:Outer membrane protein beta-barrel domain-containing protein n=1 Tax=Nonlabens marinus S1-08 TaxID=1454201 RepID=W8VWV8_9FLAO|nr:porin family protein [Nonlabens marinus]BAO56668.1 hypothetical protein NMS_2659 [Nonlabens marinus S1-08]
MKKLLLICIALGVFNFSAAQVRSETTYGIRLGLNYSNLETDYFSDSDSRIAPEVLFFAEIPLGNTFSLVPELGFSALGAKEDSFEAADGDYIDFKTNWLTAGFLAQFHLTDLLYLNAGPKFALNVSDNDDGDYYASDLLGVGGVGFQLTNSFSIDARYGYGFTNIFEGTALGDQGFEAENRFYQLTVTYKL